MTTHAITLIASTTVTGAGSDSSEWFNLSRYEEGIVYIDLTALSGTGDPSLTIDVESSPDDDEDTRQTFEAYDDSGGLATYIISSVNQVSAKFSNFGKWMRITYTLAGTSPEATFRVLFVGKV